MSKNYQRCVNTTMLINSQIPTGKALKKHLAPQGANPHCRESACSMTALLNFPPNLSLSLMCHLL